VKYEKADQLQFKKQPIVVFIEIEISWLTLKESSEKGSFAIKVCISWPVSSENPLKNCAFLKATLSNYNNPIECQGEILRQLILPNYF
jgi:hypothetical protein